MKNMQRLQSLLSFPSRGTQLHFPFPQKNWNKHENLFCSSYHFSMRIVFTEKMILGKQEFFVSHFPFHNKSETNMKTNSVLNIIFLWEHYKIRIVFTEKMITGKREFFVTFPSTPLHNKIETNMKTKYLLKFSIKTSKEPCCK